MTTIKEKPQQQILFEEVESKSTSDQLTPLKQQVIIENDNLEILAVEDSEVSQEEHINRPRWLWRIAILLLFVLVIIETVEFFIIGFNQEPLIASIYGALLFVLSLITGKVLLREYIGLSQFKQRQSLQKSVSTSLSLGGEISAIELCENISKQLPCDTDFPLDRQQYLDLNEGEILRLYSRKVLSQVDKKALDKLGKFSTEAVVLVALSPIAIVDMMLLVWRNFKMIDEISHLYGLRLSYWSRIKLIKQVFVNMVYAGASEVIADLGTDLLGADLLGKLSARLAQGLGAGMLTARLGLKTIQLCRPIPFEQEGPKLKDVRKQIITKIKSIAQSDKQQ